MTDTLADFLNARDPSVSSLQHAVRYLVAEWSDDLPPDDIPAILERRGVAQADVHRAATELARNADLLDSAVLTVLSYGWDLDAEATVGAIDEAGAKLPVVETTVIVMAVVYGLHLLMTRGRKSRTTTLRHNADGSYEITETTEWADPSSPLRAIASALTGEPSSDAGAPAIARPEQ